jgi:FHS family Na+ dependent glucose MFS transporter 1
VIRLFEPFSYYLGQLVKTQNKRSLILYFSSFIYLGMASAIIGPSFIYLVEQTSSTLTGLSILFPLRSGAFLAGSWLAGIMYDRYNGNKLLAIGLILMGITLGLIPFYASPIGLTLTLMFTGLAMSLIDVGGNILLIRIQPSNLGQAMNALHFFYGLGSFVAPLILAGSLLYQGGIQWGFWGLAIISLPVLGQLINMPAPKNIDNGPLHPEGERRTLTLDKAFLILVICLFFFSFVGVELGFGDWISTFSHRSKLADESAAVLLTSYYWGAFTIGRLISIPLAARVKSNWLVLGDLVGSFIGLGLILLFPGQRNFVWGGTMILGFSMASLFPAALTLVEGLIPLTGKLTSLILISGSVGSMFVPWLIGRNIESTGPIVIIRILFFILTLGVFMYILLSWLSKNPQD